MKITEKRKAVSDRRKNKIQASIIEQGILVCENCGHVRAAKYLYQKGIEWGMIQRVLDGTLLRKNR